jgi:thiol-disulfide isomerase/thioredoxin
MRILVFVLSLFVASVAQAQDLRRWTGGATPALELADLDGVKRSLADYRGQAVLVNFWATWCEPCREEMPSIERLRKSLEGKRFSVIAVNVGEGPAAARDFAAKVPLGATFLMDRDIKTSRAWGARVLPATFLIAPDGTVRYSHFGALDWARSDIQAIIAKMIE